MPDALPRHPWWPRWILPAACGVDASRSTKSQSALSGLRSDNPTTPRRGGPARPCEGAAGARLRTPMEGPHCPVRGRLLAFNAVRAARLGCGANPCERRPGRPRGQLESVVARAQRHRSVGIMSSSVGRRAIAPGLHRRCPRSGLLWRRRRSGPGVRQRVARQLSSRSRRRRYHALPVPVAAPPNANRGRRRPCPRHPAEVPPPMLWSAEHPPGQSAQALRPDQSDAPATRDVTTP